LSDIESSGSSGIYEPRSGSEDDQSGGGSDFFEEEFSGGPLEQTRKPGREKSPMPGTFTNTWKDTAELLLQELLPDDNPEEDNPNHRELRRSFLEDFQIVQAPPFLAEELDEALGSMNPNKAPGPQIRGETHDI